LVLQRQADLTGLPPAFIRERRLRVATRDFVQTLLADQGERTGLLDGRAHGLKAKLNDQKPPWDDPSTDHNSLTYDPNLAWTEYFEQALGYGPVTPFLWLNFDANKGWIKSHPPGDYTGAPEEMRAVMARQPNLRVLQVGGLFDLTLPYNIARRRYGGALLPPDRLVQKTYPTGHAIFADKRSQAGSIDDLRHFIAVGTAG
jgi:carboxypeptidase C (cathepsin A)